MHAEMICAPPRDFATRESHHGPAVISCSSACAPSASGRQPVSPWTTAHRTGHAMPSKTFHFLWPSVFLFYLKHFGTLKFCGNNKTPYYSCNFSLCFLAFSSVFLLLFLVYGAPGAEWRPEYICCFPTKKFSILARWENRTLNSPSDNFRKSCNLHLIQQMLLLDRKTAQGQFRWVREACVSEGFNSSRILSSITRSVLLRLGELLQPQTCNGGWLCWDRPLRESDSKEKTNTTPTTNTTSIVWLSEYCLSEFLMYFYK